jgi:hypothetical protein
MLLSRSEPVVAALAAAWAGCGIRVAIEPPDPRFGQVALIAFDDQGASVIPGNGPVEWVTPSTECDSWIDSADAESRSCTVVAMYEDDAGLDQPIRLVPGGARPMPPPAAVRIVDQSTHPWLLQRPPAKLLSYGRAEEAACPYRLVNSCPLDQAATVLLAYAEDRALAAGAASVVITPDACIPALVGEPAYPVGAVADPEGAERELWLLGRTRACEVNRTKLTCTHWGLKKLLEPLDLIGRSGRTAGPDGLRGLGLVDGRGVRVSFYSYDSYLHWSADLLLNRAGREVSAQRLIDPAEWVITSSLTVAISSQPEFVPAGPELLGLVDGLGPWLSEDMFVAGQAGVSGAEVSVILRYDGGEPEDHFAWHGVWPLSRGKIRRFVADGSNFAVATDRGLGHFSRAEGFRLCPSQVVDATRVLRLDNGAIVVSGRGGDGRGWVEWHAQP